ncbi:MAG: pyrimidine 5'-nucleotidase [Alphaproteobacteria bacterium]|nr:pyrimidine 5'-nucleotidase [Alphaproteobacteria bacterium]
MSPTTDRRLAEAETWLFDLDNTLYPARCNLFAEIELRMRQFIADMLAVDLAEAGRRQKDYSRRHGTTLRGLMSEHGLDPRAFLAYVHDIRLDALEPAPELDRALAALPARKIVFTNGSVSHAERVMERLGIARHFAAIYDIAAAGFVPKPDAASYERLCRLHAVRPQTAVMVEDMARNLLPAHALGMTTVWLPEAERRQEAEGAVHIHHVVDDLPAWLASLPMHGN